MQFGEGIGLSGRQGASPIVCDADNEKRANGLSEVTIRLVQEEPSSIRTKLYEYTLISDLGKLLNSNSVLSNSYYEMQPLPKDQDLDV